MTSTGNGKRPRTGTELGVVDDAHEAARGRGDDLLAGERRTAALDQMQLRVGLVGAVDVDLEVADGIQIQDLDAMLLEARSRALRARYGTLDRHFARRQRIDEEVHGGAGADAEDFVVGDVGQCRRGCRSLLRVRAHVIPLVAGVQEVPCLMLVFWGSGNDCARFRGHSLHHNRLEEVLLLLSGLFLAALLLGRFLLGCHSRRSPCRVSPGAVYT